MMNKIILQSDAFSDMSHGAKILYIYMCMDADDDGFVDNTRQIVKIHDLKPEHLKELTDKRFVLAFGSGIHVVKHWFLHNRIASDRYKRTKYVEERSTLQKKDDGAYTTSRIRNDDETSPQYSIVEYSKDKKNAGAKAPEKENPLDRFIPLILKEFESINPAVKRMYGNKTQRAACSFLSETYGFERVQNIVRAWLPKTNGEPYFPTITTPLQLQQKFAQLESSVRKRQAESGKSKNQVAF